jgi:hypothetical protein
MGNMIIILIVIWAYLLFLDYRKFRKLSIEKKDLREIKKSLIEDIIFIVIYVFIFVIIKLW